MHPLVRLAKDAVERHARGEQAAPLRDEDLPGETRGQAGVFVCIKVRGRLRGCIGTFQPCEPDMARETVRNAVSAASSDPRFPPVRSEELPDLEYTVDVLTPPEPAAGLADLDPKRYGVIVQAGGRRGLLLPDLEGVDTPEQQVAIARQKAGIAADAAVEIFRFEVKRYR